jgi:dTDP-4-dehydrorhamnose reductase
MKILVTGFPGQLAASFARMPTGSHSFQFASRADIDVTDEAAVRREVAAGAYDTIINCAAYTAVDRAESEADEAYLVNVEGPRTLAAAAVDNGSKLVHVSTDFVFGGLDASRPIPVDAPHSPLSVYGRTKSEGEAEVRAILGDRAMIVRTSWLHSANGPNFVTTMLRLMGSRDSLRVVADQVGSPTHVDTLSKTILGLLQADACGTFHVTDSGVASWYDFAVCINEIASAKGILQKPITVEPIRTEDYPTPAARPSYSVLDTTRTASILEESAPHWHTTLSASLDVVQREIVNDRGI